MIKQIPSDIQIVNEMGKMELVLRLWINSVVLKVNEYEESIADIEADIIAIEADINSLQAQVTFQEIMTGAGSPEGVVSGQVTQEYMDTTGTAGNIKYIKRDADVGGDDTQGWILI